MVAFGHTAVGTLVGIAAYQVFGQGDIALGLIATGFLGILSHYLMDFVPHGHFFRGSKNYEKLIIWVIILDLALPVIFLLGMAHLLGKSGTEILYILFGMGGSQLPDIIDGLRWINLLPEYRLLKIESDFHQSTHWHGKEEKALLFSYPDSWQIAVFGLALWAIIY